MKLSELVEFDQMLNDNPWYEQDNDPDTPEEAERLIEISCHGLYLGEQRCEWLGHKIEDHSYGNPESGCIDLQCERCGWNHYVTLY